MKGLSIFSRKKVKDDPISLETMSAEMTSIKSRLLSKEEEVQILKDMVAQKDEIIKRLRVRDLKVDVLRADIESAWKKFDTFLSTTSPERSKNEIKHEKEPSSAFIGPPLQSHMSKAESNLIGASLSKSDDEDEDIFKSDDEDEDISKSDDDDDEDEDEIADDSMTAIGSNRV
ncbi:hypothetical protein OIU84_000880 [Salix udensis]|uniref:Uncharacterized protein n=1 Tax=Salix udensis TaxID=889485 RepID=A0AAD6PPG0_9ROSI|nr:hypothetical protein OIU84_000880 [Salix udensis]